VKLGTCESFYKNGSARTTAEISLTQAEQDDFDIYKFVMDSKSKSFNKNKALRKALLALPTCKSP